MNKYFFNNLNEWFELIFVYKLQTVIHLVKDELDNSCMTAIKTILFTMIPKDGGKVTGY